MSPPSGPRPPNGDTSASVYAPDGARLTIESGEFTGRVAGTYASAPAETPHVSIAGGTFHNGLSYSIHETEANAATLLAILKEGYALAHADGTPVDLGTEPSFSRFSGTYTLSGEVQVVAHTHNVRSGRPGYCGCGYACPHDGQMPDSYFTLPVCSLCGVSYGTPLKDLRTPTGKIIIDENNWWQDFLNTVTFGLFFPTGARFTIEAADDSVDHAGYDPELYPVTVEYLVTDQRYTSDKMGDLADQFRPYPGKAVALPDDQTSIVYAKITDWAGNVTYLSTDDLTVDATAPEISSDVAENQIYCQDGLRIAFRDDHLKSVTLNGTEMTYAAEDGWYVLRLSAVSGSQEGQQTLTVTDEAGNGTTVHFQWYAGHSFDDTGLCSHCGLQAEARWNDAFFPHLEDALTSADAAEDGARFTAVVMLTNVSLPADAFSLDGIRAVLALEGHTLTLSAPMTLEQSSGSLTIRDSTSSGKITGQALTVKGGRLTVEAGCFENTLDLQAYNVTLFGGTFARITSEDAATLEGSAITLLRDALWSSMGLPTGTYTLDLNGKSLSGSNDLMIDGSLTICDSQGGGKLWRDGTIWVLGGHVAITGGQFNRVYLASDSADLSVTGGTFARIAYSGEDTSRTPLFFPAEGYTFQKADGSYANTGDVVMEENLRYLEDVTVTTPPFTITRYPVDTDLYPTTPVGYRPEFVTEVTFHIPESSPTIEFQWYQVGDPDRIKSYGSALAWQNPFTLYTFIDGPAQYYGIFSYKGYSVRTDVLTVRELACDHPGVDADNRCSQCHAEVAASVELNGSTGYYLSLSEALALARTDAYRGCTLTVLRSSTDPISVNSGSFTLTAAQGVMLGGKVTLAKNAAVTLSGGSYTSSASIFGSNRIEGGTFYGAVALQDGSSVSSGSFLGAVTISDTVTVTGGTFTGDVTINHGGKLVASAGTFGSVTVRTVTVEDLHIQDKLYDGTDRAEYDGEPTLGNAVSGDHVALVKGTPSFASIRTAEDIAIRFTEFSLTGADAGNYALTQPTGITASILPYALTGGEYAVNSNDWINHDFVVTAAEGYLLSLTDTADGVWQQTLRAADETAEGRLTFYVKDLATGATSLQVTEQYRIDRTQPTGEIRVDERTAWQSFLSRITFDLFYREEQTVVITSADETSGVAATEYLLSAEDLDIPALEQETFLPYEKALALAPDGEYVVYARITDRAGNVTYLRSDGMVLDATAPAITGAENSGVYCAAVTLTITDAYPVTVTVNGTPVELTEGRLVLRPAEGTQLVTATDPAGNESRLEITVNDGHTWGDWSSNGDDTHTRTCTISGCGAPETESCTGSEATCVDQAVCEVCGGAYGDVDAHCHADLRHVEAKAATTEAPGNIEYWYCAACGKYFADAQASRELRQADTVTEKLPAIPTGDEAPLTLWVIVLAACAGLALLLLVLRRRNSHRAA